MGDDAADADGGMPDALRTGFVFSPYKDITIDLNWNTNVVTTKVSGDPTTLTTDLTHSGGDAITLAFATGECGMEGWGGVTGAALATANLALLKEAGVQYVLSTGGAAGSFTCASDAGMTTFLDRWDSPGLIGIDYDIEAGQTEAVIRDLIARIPAAHAAHPKLRFSLTLATLAASESGQTRARSLGGSAQDSLNVYGVNTLKAAQSAFGLGSNGSQWPEYVTVNLMTMDYGAAGPGNCVVAAGSCQMGESALQAAYNLHDKWGVPFAQIEITPMIGGNDVQGEQFTLDDVDTIVQFARTNELAGLHYWSYDRDRDCPVGAASATCNSFGAAGTRGFLKRFLAALKP